MFRGSVSCGWMKGTLRLAVVSALFSLPVSAVLLAVAGPSFAAPVKIEAVVTPKEQIRLDFVDGSKHFVLGNPK